MLPLLLLLICVSPVLIGSLNDGLVALGRLIIYAAVIAYIIFSLNWLQWRVRTGKAVFLALFAFWAWMLVRSVSVYGLALLMQFTLIAAFFVVMSSEVRYSEKMVRRVFTVAGGVFFASCALEFTSGWYLNRNFVGALAFLYCMLLFAVWRGIFVRLCIFGLGGVLAGLAGARSVLVAFLFAIAYTWIVSNSRLLAWQKKILIIGFLVCVAALCYVLLELRDSYVVNDWLLENTGKRFETGRIDMWAAILSDFDAMKYLTGVGGGADLGLDENLSAHSLYVSTIHSYGLVGLVLLLWVFGATLRKLFDAGLVLSFFGSVALMVRDFFEVSLIHNNFPIAIVFWGLFMSGFVGRVNRVAEA